MNEFFLALSLIPFYLIGAFPTGYILARRAGIDIASAGSGNVGATNLGRVLGKKAGILTLFGDVLKGVTAVMLAHLCVGTPWYDSLVAAVAVMGHCFSVPPLLRGGKGVATSLGVLVALKPILALAAIVIFGITFWMKRTVSLASVAAALLIPVVVLVCGMQDYLLYGIVPIAFVIVYKHRANLDRLAKGTEPKFEFKK